MHKRISRRELLRQLLLAASGAALGGCSSPASATQPASGELVQITILHINDLHGALYAKAETGGERGGAANLVGLIDRQRALAPGPVLLFDAGDAFQGTFVSNSNQGQAVIEIFNVAAVDAMALGNHEFDWGIEVLQARAQEARFPFLAANLEAESGEAVGGVSPYAVLDADGIQVAVLGLTYHPLSAIVKASEIEGMRSLSPAETVQRYLPELRDKADLFVILSHLGLEGDEALARAVPEIPLIVGGHNHKVLPEGHKVRDTLIVQAGAYGRDLGKLVIRFDRRKGQIVDIDVKGETIRVTHAGTPSAEVEAIVKRWGAETDKAGATVIGEAAVRLSKERSVEMALGNLITDAMRATDLGDGKVFDIALHNDGGIRADLDSGPITYAELYAVLPFDNNLVGLDLTGAQVKEMLEKGIADYGSEIQVSGLSFVYVLKRAQGKRVTEVSIGGKALDPDRVYRVVTIDYLYTHPQYEDSLGAGADVFFGGLCLDAVIDYVSAHSPVHPEVEQRIQRK